MNCNHEVTTKIENGMIITYCKKCGKILDTAQASNGSRGTWREGLIEDNGGEILHDTPSYGSNGTILHD